MHYSLGLEQSERGRWVAWVLELPGCFSRSESREEAIACAPRAIADYFNWRDGYERVTEDIAAALTVAVVEEYRNYETLDGYWVNAFFDFDRRPLAPSDTDDIRWLLSCTRSDLMATVQRIPVSALDQPIEAERFATIRGVLKHVALAERWYFDKLGLAVPKEDLGTDIFNMLEVVRRNTIVQLPRLAHDTSVRDVHGELWSARKIVRRTLWHERVHTWHLQRLLGQLRQSS
jgi:hypothetical protein